MFRVPLPTCSRARWYSAPESARGEHDVLALVQHELVQHERMPVAAALRRAGTPPGGTAVLDPEVLARAEGGPGVDAALACLDTL